MTLPDSVAISPEVLINHKPQSQGGQLTKGEEVQAIPTYLRPEKQDTRHAMGRGEGKEKAEAGREVTGNPTNLRPGIPASKKDRGEAGEAGKRDKKRGRLTGLANLRPDLPSNGEKKGPE